MTYLIAILLVGINIAPFIFPQLDIWHAQGIFTQTAILILFSASLLKSPNFIEPKNKELGLLHLWVGLQTAWICFVSQTNHKYDITHFFPYFNFLCLVILYRIIVQYLNRENIELCMVFLKYAIVANLLVSVLQFLGASQFFELFYPTDGFHNNPINGFIGNGTHLSGFLAMMIPVFLYFGKREDYLCLVLMGVLLCLSGTSTNEPSISGWIVGGALISLWIAYIKNISVWYMLAGVVGLVILVSFIFPQFISVNGRTGFWSYYFPIIKKWFVTGTGLGTMNGIYKESANPNVRHLHMEYFQFILEIGIIGVVLGLNLIKKFWEIQVEDKLGLSLKLIFIGFCISACFNYPAHLWLVSTYAVFSYAAVMVLKRGDNYAR